MTKISAEEESASVTQWMAVIGSTIAAFIAIVDIQVTNSSLENIRGSLSASIAQSTWISTAYLIAEVIIIPITGWMSQIFSLKRYILASVFLFVVFSICSGLSWNLTSMIIFRGCQGLFGGALIPLAQIIILRFLPEKQQAKGMALFGISAVCAPTLGPLLGGWLTNNWNWHVIFFINVIPGIVMFILLKIGLPKEKPQYKALTQRDWVGFITMAVGLACLQIVLEEGNINDWFSSAYIRDLAFLSFFGLTLFIIRSFTNRHPIIELRIFSHLHFAFGSMANFSVGFCLYATVYLLPVYLSSVQNYNPEQIGKVIMWMGLPQLLVVPFIPLLISRINIIIIMLVGISLLATSFWLTSLLGSNVAGPQLHSAQILRAIGLPLVMTPLMLASTFQLPKSLLADASGMFNVLRNIGGAIGIATVSTLLTNRTFLHEARLRENLPATIEAIRQSFHGLPALSNQVSLSLFNKIIHRQASILAFSDNFLLLTMMLIISSIIVIIMGYFLPKKSKQQLI